MYIYSTNNFNFMSKKEKKESKKMVYLGLAVAISTLLLNAVQIRYFINEERRNGNLNGNRIK